MFCVSIKWGIDVDVESECFANISDRVNNKISCFVEEGIFFRIEVVLSSKEESRKDSDKLVSRNKMVGVEDGVRISVIIQSHDTKLTRKFHIILQFIDFIFDIIEFTDSCCIRFEM
jgi:hypothetical protein